MTLAVILIIFAALAFCSIVRTAVSRELQPAEEPGLEAHIQPVDIEAFRNLINPSEDDHLRRRLPSAEFRHVRRARLRAAAAYVQVAGRNATILARIGESAQISDNQITVEAATRLVDQSMQLKGNAFVALVRIRIALVWPNFGLEATPVLDGYRELSGAAMLLGRLQNPAEPVRIAAS